MAKLNRTEISAIAEDIYTKITTPIDNYNKELTSDKAFEEWREGFCKTQEYNDLIANLNAIENLNKFFNKYEFTSYNRSKVKVKVEINKDYYSLVRIIWENSLQLKIYPTTIEKISQDLIIAQARNEGIDTMIESIIQKYS